MRKREERGTMAMDDPLDFEFEDPVVSSPVSKKNRRKVIGLDDLLTDYYKDKSKIVERESKRAKSRKNYYSDEDDNDSKEATLSRCVDECQNQMKEISCDEEILAWGLQVFGNQKNLPPPVVPELSSCKLLQSFMKNSLNSLVELTTEKGDIFLEGLLINGWLSKLVVTSGHVEKSIAAWAFNLMLYSSQEELRTSACDFWCAILSSKNQVDALPIKIDWLPSYAELKGALETYGFLFSLSSATESVHTDSGCQGPPQNIRGWIKFTAACCRVRSKHPVFSTSEAEELVEVVICLFIDRKLQGLSVLLFECLTSAICFFTDTEWTISCKRISKSLACRVPRDLNCLRAVECISGVDKRSKYLRSAIAYQILVACFDYEADDEEKVLQSLISINVKDRSCDLFKLYIYLGLTEDWLLSNSILEHKPVLCEMWGLYLRNCSCQIASTDLRSYASKVRNKASYLIQASGNK